MVYSTFHQLSFRNILLKFYLPLFRFGVYYISIEERLQEQFVKSNRRKQCYFRSSHLQYVFDCLNKTTSRVGNIKSYLLTTLYNATATMKSYYDAAVRHDHPYLFCKED